MLPNVLGFEACYAQAFEGLQPVQQQLRSRPETLALPGLVRSSGMDLIGAAVTPDCSPSVVRLRMSTEKVMDSSSLANGQGLQPAALPCTGCAFWHQK